MSAGASGALAWLQGELEHVQAIETEHRVEDYVVSRETLERLGVRPPRAEEEVLVVEERDEIALAVYLAPRVLATLRKAAHDPDSLFGRHLPTMSLAIEGVSHFVYLASRASVRRPVSLLELEVQAEIDKFALAALHLWRSGRREAIPNLHARLFDEVGYRPGLGEAELERYRTANRLARGYCRALLRYVEQGRVEPLLAELRRAWRLGAGEKYSHLRRAIH